MKTIAEIAEFLAQENETSACLTIDVRPMIDCSKMTPEILNTYVTSLGFRSINEGWQSIPKPQVQEILGELLHRDLAYSEEIMPWETARYIASQFIACFEPDSYSVFSNASFKNYRLSSWSPLSVSTFDAAIAIYDAHNIGIIHVDAED